MTEAQANIIMAQNEEILLLLRGGALPAAALPPRRRIAKPSPAVIAYELLSQHVPSILPYIKKPA